MERVSLRDDLRRVILRKHFEKVHQHDREYVQEPYELAAEMGGAGARKGRCCLSC